MPRLSAAVLLCLVLQACGSGSGDVAIVLEAEDTITSGLTPGMGEENIVDGWTVTYTQFAVAVGRVELTQQAIDTLARAGAVRVVDLVSAPATGIPLVAFDALPTGVWDVVTFETPAASADAMRDPSVSQSDFDEMVASGCTYLIAGSITNPGGQSCPPGGVCMPAAAIDFRFCIPAPTRFGPCSGPDGMPGLTVGAGLTTSSAITLHGDHFWFTSFPSGEELVQRRAQWLSNCDADHDGTVTRAELEAADAAAIFPSAEYSLAGAPRPVATAWDFVTAQASTQGHWNGEGECPIEPL